MHSEPSVVYVLLVLDYKTSEWIVSSVHFTNEGALDAARNITDLTHIAYYEVQR